MDKGSSLPIKDFISLWYLLQRVGCSVQTPDSLFFTNTSSFVSNDRLFSCFFLLSSGHLGVQKGKFCAFCAAGLFCSVMNLPYLTLQSDPFCVAICVIWRCHLRHFIRWNASYCNVFWLILSANLLDFVRRFHFSKVLSSVFRLSVRHFSLGMNITKWEHSGHRLWCKRQMRMLGVSLNGGPTCGSLLVNKS